MNQKICMKKMQLVGVLAFATVDADNKPQEETKKCVMEKKNCLHCGRCKAVCPVQAIERIG